jgi:tRNA 2-selenouridine synthase
MLSYVTFDEIESSLDRYTVVDVRSPKEYADSTIVGAVNIPLFPDAERAHVGTL